MERQKPAIYREETDKLKAAAIGQDLAGKIDLVRTAEQRGRVNLQDTEAVRAVALAYMERCQEDGRVPTVMALSAALGMSRRWLNMFMQNNPQHPTTALLEVLKEIFADALTQAGLYRHVSDALAIFILKNTASMADKVEVEPRISDDGALGPRETREQLEAKILGTIVQEDPLEVVED